jgi:hypothetical protein
MDAGADGTLSTTPIGRAGRLEAAALEVAGDHALLVRETGPDPRARALLITDKLPTGERLVVMPLDDEVDVRVDGDALAVWLGSGVMGEVPHQERAIPHDGVPIWATVVGGTLLVLTLVFAVIGSAVVFTWLSRMFA